MESVPTSARNASLVRPARASSITPLDRWLADRLRSITEPAGVGVVLWDGVAGSSGRVGDLVVADRRTLIGLLAAPDLYFGESFASGRLSVRGDLLAVVRGLSGDPAAALRPAERLQLVLGGHTSLMDARRNVHRHYDLGNDFYSLWLDRDLLYSCAYFPDQTASLEDAQEAKLQLICRKLRLMPGERVIEAGCGWGGLSLYMAREYGVTVRAFNISTEQLAYARARAAREGLADRVEFVEDDYRNVTGRYDAFVSVGMLEHVGARQFADLADAIGRTLDRERGRGLLHFIGRDRPRPLNAWIRRRIFPGAYAPSLGEVSAQVLEPAGMSVLDVENLRLHYALTLRHWAARFDDARNVVAEQAGDAFVRAWRLYLAGSQAAFETGWLQLFQVVFAPAGRRTLRWTRADLYPADTAIRGT